MAGSRRWQRERDVLLALGTGLLAIAGTLLAPPSGTDLDARGYGLIMLCSLMLVARRRAPAAVLLATCAFVFAYHVFGYPGYVVAVPVLVALYTAVKAGHVAVVAVPFVAHLAAMAAEVASTDAPVRDVVGQRFMLTGWLVAAVAMGVAIRQWEAHVREVEERAAEAERTREETARRRAGEERLRIARELHDSLTHTISVIKVQAGVAVHLARKRGEQVPEALVAIQEASGEATRELRDTLEVLRHDELAPGGSGLDRLDDLVESAGAAGVPAVVSVDGTARALPPAVDRAAYRIIQEALTNVGRHAGAAKATVQLTYAPSSLAIRVDDDGCADERAAGISPPYGMGLRGMHERVGALGGQLRAGPRPGGGFTVDALLPLDGAS